MNKYRKAVMSSLTLIMKRRTSSETFKGSLWSIFYFFIGISKFQYFLFSWSLSSHLCYGLINSTYTLLKWCHDCAKSSSLRLIPYYPQAYRCYDVPLEAFCYTIISLSSSLIWSFWFPLHLAWIWFWNWKFFFNHNILIKMIKI